MLGSARIRSQVFHFCCLRLLVDLIQDLLHGSGVRSVFGFAIDYTAFRDHLIHFYNNQSLTD